MVSDIQKQADLYLIAKAIEPKEFEYESLKSIKDKNINEHLYLYKGYVDNYNKIVDLIRKTKPDDTNPHYSNLGEIRRRLVWAHNGVFLHNLFFENIGGNSDKPEYRTNKLITSDFKNVNKFKKQILDSCQIPSPGWVVWGWSMLDEKTHIFVLEDHHNNCPIGVVPLLVIDCWEHSYYLDHKTDKEKYIKKLWNDINWSIVEDRVELLKRFMKG